MLKRLFSDPTNLMNLDEGVLKGLSLTPPRKVDKPTYEIVGPLERYDEHNQVIARFRLQKGSARYEDYYSRHPERKARDNVRHQRAERSGRKRMDEDPINEQLGVSGNYGAILLSRPDIVNAEIKSRTLPTSRVEVGKIDVEPAKMSKKIKALGLHLGAAKVGIAELDQNWVSSYSHVPSSYGEPVELDYKHIICMAFTQNPFMTASQVGIGANLEVGWKYSYASLVSTLMANFIRHLGWRARPLPTGNAPYLVIPTFIDAGIGEYGRCGFVVTKEFGNNWRPGAVATDLPLATDKPVDFGLQDFCDKCKICAEHCPAQAITEGDKVVFRGVRKWKIDEEKCFDYWQTIGQVCTACQFVCPWNHPNNLFHNIIREIAERYPSLRNVIIKADRFFYKYKPSPVPRWMTDLIYK